MPRHFVAGQLSPYRADAVQRADDLVPEIQNTLATLADVETRYQVERERLEQWSGPEAVKQRLSGQIESRHQLDREPLVQRLAELHQRMTDLALFSRFRLVH